MKKTLTVSLLSLSAICAPAFAQSFTEWAHVESVQPITERTPINRKECWNEQRRGYEDRQVTRQDNGAVIGPGTVIGAIAGGVLGHQFGNSSGGRDRGTAAGAIVGGLVGHEVDKQNGAVGGGDSVTETERVPVTREVEHCRNVQEVREVAVGYDVRYRFAGRDFVTRMPYDPGPKVHISVQLNPVVDNAPPPPGPPQPQPPVYRR